MLDAGLVESRSWHALPYGEGVKLVPSNEGAPVRAGDTIYLRSGYYGDLRVVGYYNAANVYVVAQDGHVPRFRSLLVQGGSHWVFRGLHISPEHAPTYEKHAPTYEKTVLFRIDSRSRQGPVSDIVVEDCTLQSVADSSRWTADDWNRLSCSGVQADGNHLTLRNNVLKNVDFGISVNAEDSLIEGNLVENFAGDGMRGLGNRSVFQYNTVKNCYDVNDNHDDGFQSWSMGSDGVGSGEVQGVVLRGNTFINNEAPDQPYRGQLQGIGCFDGTYVDWVIENNVVVVDTWHGITLLGARNSRIVNNTVVDSRAGGAGPPWIKVGPHKNGTASTGNVIRNNLSASIRTQGDDMSVDHNQTVKDPRRLFVDAPAFDFRLRRGARAVDAGSAKLAPEVDRDRFPRPWGRGYDVGAYEYHRGEALTEAPTLQEAVGAREQDPSASSPEPRREARSSSLPPAQEPRAHRRPEAKKGVALIAWIAFFVVASLLVLWRLRGSRK